MAVDEVNDLLDGELPEGRLGHASAASSSTCSATCPAEGESVEVEGYRLSAEKVQGRRIGRVRVTPRPESAGPADDEGGGGINVDWVPTR